MEMGKGKGEEMGDHAEGGIWPTHKFWVWRPFARPLAGFKAKRRGGRKGKEVERNGKGEEGQEGGKWEGWKLKQGRRLTKAGAEVEHYAAFIGELTEWLKTFQSSSIP